MTWFINSLKTGTVQFDLYALTKALPTEFTDINLISDLCFSLIKRPGDDNGFCPPDLDTVATSPYCTLDL